MTRYRVTPWRVAGVFWLVLISACGGGGGDTPAAPAILSITSSATGGSVDEGGSAINVALAGATSANGAMVP